METAAVRGGSLPATSSSSSSQSVRREWRAVSEHSYRNNANEEAEHSKFGQTDERTIHEEAVGSLEVGFCSVTINGGNDVVLRKQLLDVSRRREELQQMEIQLRAQTIVRSEIMEVQNNYEAQLKEHSSAAAKLKEQLQERDQHIRELELKMEEKDRELHAVNNEAAWAKEDFLREQNEKLATFRRERDTSEAEKAQHLKQIHDLQEHIKEKESHFLALEEQHRVAQDAILYKDERLREAHAWIARLQEMGALQSSSLQAELQERIDQFHQYYLSFQRQVMEMERHHVQAMQQLQLELAEARERNGVHSNSSQVTSGSSMDSSLYDKSQGNENNSIDGVTLNGTSTFMPNGKLNGAASFVSLSNTSSEVEHAPGMPVVPSSIVGVGEMPSGKHADHFYPPGQAKPMPPFFMHPQGVPQSLSSTNSFITPELHQHWQSHQVLTHATQSTVKNEHQISNADRYSLESSVHYKYELPVDKREVHEDQLNTRNKLQLTSGAITNGSIVEVQLVKSIEKNPYQMSQEAEENLSTNSQCTYGFDCPQQNNELKVVESDERSYQTSQVPHNNLSTNSKFHGTGGFDVPQQMKQNNEVHNETKSPLIIHQKEPALHLSQQWSTATVSVSSIQNNYSVISSNIAKGNGNLITSEGSVSAPLTSSPLTAGTAIEPTLLDERSLLACIVRAIPAGSGNGIRISSTLPNRLGKMLAPLHWHDYKKKYGKLDDFVSHHPELFIIEGDFIHLREGAQEKISATTAVAKVAAAAASSAPYSSLLPSVAVTPVAQANRLRKTQLTDSNSLITVQPTEVTDLRSHGDLGDINPQIPKMHSQQLNGFSFNTQQARSDVKILSKTSLTKDIPEIHGSSEMRPHRLPNPVTVNGVTLSRTLLPPSQNKESSNGRHGSGGKRHVGVGFVSSR